MNGPLRNHVEARSSRGPARQYVSETHDHKPDAAGDQFDAIMHAALERVAARDTALHQAVLEDIRRNGTYWAAGEICRLRRELQSARRAKGNAS